MAVAFDAASQGNAAAATSLTYAHTTTGADRGLFAGVCVNDNRSITGVTYNGISMTAVETGSPSYRLYGLIAPATGANNVVVSVDAAGNITSVAVSVTGMDQTTGWDGVQVSTTISQSDQGVTVTSAVDNLVLGTLIVVPDASVTSLTPGSGQTTRGTPQQLAYSYCAMSTEAGASSVSHTYAYAAATAAFVQRIVAVNVRAASTGPTYSQSASGSVSLSGALTKQKLQTLAAGLTPAGALTRRAEKPLAGACTPAGALARWPGKRADGTIAPSAVVVKETRTLLAGTVTPAGAVDALRSYLRAFTGTITPTGTLTPIAILARAFTGTLGLAGTLVKRPDKALAGTVASAGAATRAVWKLVGGELVVAGVVAKQPRKRLEATLPLTGITVTVAGTFAQPGPHPLRITFTGHGKVITFVVDGKRIRFVRHDKSIRFES